MSGTPATRPLRSRVRRVLVRGVQVLAAVFVLFVVIVVVDGWRAFGSSASGARRERIDRSPQHAGGEFVNPQPMQNHAWKMVTGLFSKSSVASPSAPPPVEAVEAARFASPPESGLRVTWLGHSTIVIELDGHRVLTDPVWSDRISPVSWAGPSRFYPPPLELDDLPRLDAVLLSHDHYDHLDYPTIVALKDTQVRFVTPIGVGAHLEYWGVTADRIDELDWWEEVLVGELRVACTPARHASGRTLFDTNETLWASYALIGPHHRAWFSGDTGLFPALSEIGERYGPFDVTMIEAGAYGNAWPDWHLGPEQAVTAHGMVRGQVMMPIHWGLFDLAYHGWTEPIERVLVAAESAGVTIVAPRPGQSVEPSSPPAVERWWPDVPWRTGEQDPIVATKME